MSFLYCAVRDLSFVCIYRPHRHAEYTMQSIADGVAWSVCVIMIIIIAMTTFMLLSS